MIEEPECDKMGYTHVRKCHDGTHGYIDPTENLKASHRNMGFYCTWYSAPREKKLEKTETICALQDTEAGT